MPALVVTELKRIDQFILGEIPYNLYNKYSLILEKSRGSEEIKIRGYLSRIYREDGEVIMELKRFEELPVRVWFFSYYVDLTYIHIIEGIQPGYYISILFVNFIHKLNDKIIETPIAPNEFLVLEGSGVPDTVKKLVRTEVEILESVAKDFEVVGFLYKAELKNVALDLLEALRRFYTPDYEGSIIFARKVVEGLRNLVEKGVIPIPGEKRAELFRDYLSKAFQLISNFGMHSGTQGFKPEAELSKDIAVSACRYLAAYMDKGENL
ncbi:hypothetical protein QPL79_05850 [Ignisphaera sp. 4213-co]|uniref:DUF4145 domain-containing protein n=1 Tax=Ignisphaera cupida TaxID=3050454 RepID=A0ABD4Z6D6_9CREN|nr:hypothetical protein [Ignisphaera sp. 4213-co]MDK6028881.1 hypothetical protein [Ignisphaera sp. 4213-co]